MKRLILVGNGFDLAHGLKTSYCDFIRWYLMVSINIFTEKGTYEDDLILLNQKNIHAFNNPPYLPSSIESSIQVFQDLKNDAQYNAKYSFEILIKSDLLKGTIDNTVKINWVDIELEYFEILAKHQNNDGSFNINDVKALNIEFNFIKNKLKEYLQTQELNLEDLKPDGDILNVIKSEFKWRDFDTGFEKEEGDDFKSLLKDKDKKYRYPASISFLNFNYTNTVEKYISSLKEYDYHKNTSINYIHGKLKSGSNPIIFGFGDEYNAKYKQFEEQQNNEVFEHIKSYWYFKSSNYRELIRYLNSSMFQVFILGHSCGLSDRTMFREIFEHDNCKAIKIFYYEKSDGSNDFHEKTVELGRHFTNKGKMRKKIVEFNMSSKFPQPKLNS